MVIFLYIHIYYSNKQYEEIETEMRAYVSTKIYVIVCAYLDMVFTFAGRITR